MTNCRSIEICLLELRESPERACTDSLHFDLLEELEEVLCKRLVDLFILPEELLYWTLRCKLGQDDV